MVLFLSDTSVEKRSIRDTWVRRSHLWLSRRRAAVAPRAAPRSARRLSHGGAGGAGRAVPGSLCWAGGGCSAARPPSWASPGTAVPLLELFCSFASSSVGRAVLLETSASQCTASG